MFAHFLEVIKMFIFNMNPTVVELVTQKNAQTTVCLSHYILGYQVDFWLTLLSESAVLKKNGLLQYKPMARHTAQKPNCCKNEKKKFSN